MNIAPLHSRKLPDQSPDNGFQNPPLSYAPWAFWFWNGPLLPEQIAEQAAEMCRQRLNPGYVHSRFHPNYPTENWLSEDWFASLEAALERTTEAGMFLTYTTGDPNIPHRMILEKQPELKAESLGWTTADVPGGTTFQVPASFFTVAAQLDSTGQLLSASLEVVGAGPAFSWQAPEGHIWRLFIFNKYHGVNPAGAPVNFLDRRLGPTWIDVEHRLYDERLRRFMGNTMPGIFVDHEGSYGYKLAWSEDLAKKYQADNQRDIRQWMPLMVEEDAEGRWGKARWDWFHTVTHLYSECLMAPTRDWSAERGMNVTCHFWEENLYAQAMQVGSLFVAQRAYSVPGTDSLFLDVMKPRDFKETQSVSEFEGRQSMSEIFGIAGWHLTPATMKQAANCGIAWGITHFVPHGINSNTDFRRVSYPPDFFSWNPYWRHLHLWTDFIRRAAYVNDHGRLDAEVLLLHPIDSVWALLGDGIFDPARPHDTYPVKKENIGDARHASEIEHIEVVYSQAMDDLARSRVDFLIADDHYLTEMEAEQGLLARGEFAFQTVVLPPLKLIPLGVARKLVQLAESGGHVYALGSLPGGSAENGMDDPAMKLLADALRAAPGFAEAPDGLLPLIAAHAAGLARNVEFESGEFALLSSRRKIGNRSFVWLANDTAERHECILHIRNASGEAVIWDCETGTRRIVASEDAPAGSKVTLTFEPYEAFWLVYDPSRQPLTSVPEKIASETVLALDGLWRVGINPENQPVPADPSYVAPDTTGERSLESWSKWGLRHFSGFVDYERDFEIDRVDGTEVLDLAEVKHLAEVWINGQFAGERLWAPFKFPIGSFLRPGRNTIRIRVGNLVLNAVARREDYNWRWHTPPTDAELDAGLFGPVFIVRPNRASDRKKVF